jgi:hypothetical protein
LLALHKLTISIAPSQTIPIRVLVLGRVWEVLKSMVEWGHVCLERKRSLVVLATSKSCWWCVCLW